METPTLEPPSSPNGADVGSPVTLKPIESRNPWECAQCRHPYGPSTVYFMKAHVREGNADRWCVNCAAALDPHSGENLKRYGLGRVNQLYPPLSTDLIPSRPRGRPPKVRPLVPKASPDAPFLRIEVSLGHVTTLFQLMVRR